MKGYYYCYRYYYFVPEAYHLLGDTLLFVLIEAARKDIGHEDTGTSVLPSTLAVFDMAGQVKV